MKKHNLGKSLILSALILSLLMAFAGCNQAGQEAPATEPTTEPTAAPTETEPVPSETVPEETEPDPVILQAGTMSKHMKGKNGDQGIYFTMEPNEIPADSSWKTEYRPTSKSTIQLTRGGVTYDIARTAAGMVVKYSDTEYYLKLEQWLLKDYFPVRDGDVITVGGVFKNGANGVMFQIDTSYIQISEGLVFFSTEFPTGSGVNVKYVGNPTSHPNGKTSDGIYFTLEKNSVPYNGWSVEYSPASESAVQLIRDGKTYNIGNKAAGTIVKFSDTEYYLKLENWIIKNFYPIRDGDVIVLNGKFVNSGVSTVFSISKTYISINEGLLTFSDTYPTESTVEAIQIPTLLEHPNGYTGTGVYFRAEENTLPYDGWSVEYFPREAGCIKLIRNGETYDIANVDAGTIVKYSDTDYYLKLEKWIYKNHFPFVDGDILVVEGKFVNAGLAGLMEIGKTYIAINGGMAYFSTEFPEGPVGPTVISGGSLSSHPEGWNSAANGGLFFKLEPNDAPFSSDWGLRYTPTSASNVKLLRDGVTTDVANTGAEMLVKYNETSYYLEFWPISLKPIVEGDTLIIEGNFVNAANNVVIALEKTYVTIENGQPVFSAENDSVIEAGFAQPHPNGFNTNSGDGLYFKLDANEVPYDGWNVEYEPVSASSLQLIRGDETINIGIPSRGTLVKFSDTEYYLKLAKWTIGDYFPIVPGDVLVMEGKFKNSDNGVTFNISRSVITVGEDYVLTFGEEDPVDKVIQAGVMSSHPNGWNTSNNKGMYFTLESNEVPYTDDWQTVYFPTTADNIKLIRGGETVSIAQTDREYIVKFEDTGYYLKLETWTIGDNFPIVPGDVIIVEGNFANPVLGVEFAVSKTYITVGDGYSLTFSQTPPAEEPEDDGSIQAGALLPHHEKGFNTGSKDGLYAVMAANAAPYDGWNIEYTPAEAGSYKLVRNGETFDIGIPGRGTLVKYSDTEYYLKFGWCVGDYANTITIGDQLIVEGKWKQNTGGDTVLNIEKTVITIGEDYVLTFESEGGEPETPDVPVVPENHGPMATHPANGWTATGGLYFTMAANDVPYDGWNTRYVPTAESNVKLIRGGKTYDVAHTQRETIVKYSDTEYYYEFWTLDTYKPVVAGDVLVVEGSFYNAAKDATLTIKKTTITFNADGTATFQSEAAEPEVPENPENDGPLAVHTEHGWTAGTEAPWGGLYFTMQKNTAPYADDWSVRYLPTKAATIKLIRNGVSYDVANTAAEMITKYSETEYYMDFWPISQKPILAGDIFVVEGEFTNATKNATIIVAKTTITLNADGTATFESEITEPEDPEQPEVPDDGAIQAGNMASHTSGLTSTHLFFTMAENDVPYHLTKAVYKPEENGVIKLIRDGVLYEIGDPSQDTIQKTTKSNYKLKLSALALGELGGLKDGDILIVEGKFTGGNTNTGATATFNVAKTFISIVDGKPVFSSTDPRA